MKLTSELAAQLVDDYSQRIADARIEQSDLEREWAESEEYYQATQTGITKSSPWAGASNLDISLAGTYVDQTVARIMGALFSVEPHWVVKPPNEKWSKHADSVERFLEACRKGYLWNQYQVVWDAVLEMCKLGTCVLYTQEVEEQYLAVDEASGTMVPGPRFFGPRVSWVPRIDFTIPAGWADAQHAPWIAHRMWYSWPDLQRLLKQGYLDIDFADPDQLEHYSGDNPTH